MTIAIRIPMGWLGMLFYFLSYVAIFESSNLFSQHRDVFLIIGQSNTAGRGTIEAKDEAILQGVDLFESTTWVAASNPMNAHSNIRKKLSLQKLSYAYTFGRTVHEVTGTRIGLVVNARGGTAINDWQKGATAGYYDATMTRLAAALATPGSNLKGILWHQGEANRNDSAYLTKLQQLIQDFRTDLGIADLPFIAGQLSQERVPDDNATFNTNLTTLPSLVADTDYVVSDGLGTTDQTHFDANGQRVLGSRYASKVLQMVYNFELRTENIRVSADAYVRAGSASDDNFGAESLVRIKEYSGNANETKRRGYLKFDMSTIPGQIIDADLWFKAVIQNGTKSMDLVVSETGSNWSESTITWNNRPAMTTAIVQQEIDGSDPSAHRFFLSEYVQEKMGNTSIALGLKGANDTNEQLRIWSKEDSSSPEDAPHLRVDYLVPRFLKNEASASLYPQKFLAYQDLQKGYVVLENSMPIKHIALFNRHGQLLFIQRFDSKQVQIPVHTWAEGIYLIVLKDANGTYSQLFGLR